jgi:hypothetical protein
MSRSRASALGRAFCAAALVVAWPPLVTAADGCGTQNAGVAKSIEDAWQNSMFAFTYEDAAAEPPNRIMGTDGIALQFVGNAFLIDDVDDGHTQTGYIATAKHNLLIACQNAAPGDGAKVRMVAASGISFPIVGPSKAECADLMAIYAKADAKDVIFDPDFAVVKAILPADNGWKPLLVGTAGSTGSNGEIDHLDASLALQPASVVALPTPAVQRPEYASYTWLRAIAGNNVPGISGSPYVTTTGGQRPVALGMLTNSIPPGGAPLVGARHTWSKTEVANMVSNMQADLAAKSFSLIATFDALPSEYGIQAVNPEVRTLFEQAESDSFQNMSRADRLRKKLAASGLSSLAYIKSRCTELGTNDKPNVYKLTFCTGALSHLDDFECFYLPDEFTRYVANIVRRPQTQFSDLFGKPAAAVKVANELRPLVATAGQPTAATATILLQSIFDQPHQGILVSERWDSAAIFDLALAEKKANGDSDSAAYLARLKQALDLNPKNKLAKKAFVDSAVRLGARGDTSHLSDAVKYVSELQRNNAIEPAEASRTLSDAKLAVRRAGGS